MKKLSFRLWISLILIGLMGQFAWTIENMYFNVFLYNTISTDPGYIAAMVSASAVAATLTTLFMGALSDRVGRRKAFICVGYLLWGVSTAAFGFITVENAAALLPSLGGAAGAAILVIVMDCVMTFFGSAANDACFNAWLTEAAPPGSRGAAEGVNAMMPLMAILVVFGGFMGFDLDQPGSWVMIFRIIGLTAVVIGAAGIFLIDETGRRLEENRRIFGNLFYGFRPSVIRGNAPLYITLICYTVFSIAIQVYMPYLILYYTVGLKLENYVLIMAPAIILAAAFTAVYGRRYDRRGYWAAAVPTVLLLLGGCLILYIFRATPLVFAGSLLMMCGYLSGMAVFGAKIRDHTPQDKAGMFQGLRIISQVLIPGVIGPAIGATVLRNAGTIVNDDGTSSFIPNETIFLAASVVLAVLLVLWLALYLHDRRGRQAAV